MNLLRYSQGQSLIEVDYSVHPNALDGQCYIAIFLAEAADKKFSLSSVLDGQSTILIVIVYNNSTENPKHNFFTMKT